MRLILLGFGYCESCNMSHYAECHFSEYFTPSVTFLSDIHSDVMLSVAIKSNILSVSDECRSSVVMVSFVCREYRYKAQNAGCHNAECCYAGCHYAECCYAECHFA